jgi:membrane protein required for colicin V production
MNLLDIIIIAVMFFFMLKGILRGFIREIASLAGVITGIWLANLFQPQMTEYLKSYVPAIDSLPLISFVIIFVSVLIVSSLLGWFLKLSFKKADFGWADRTLGVGLATLKGVIIVYLVIVLLTFFIPAKTPLIADSKLAPLVIMSYQSMVRLISPDDYQKLKKKIMEKKEEMGEIVSEKIEDLATEDGQK